MRTFTVVSLVLTLLGVAAAPAFAQSSDDPSAKDADLFNKDTSLKSTKSDEEKAKDAAKDEKKSEDDDLDDKVFYSGFGVERATPDYANLGAATNLVGVLGFR